ncbi:hypothetical protein BWI93_24975 [Siphonobacter sp. BAB-5385]|uniref:hypothetical protein n=1 Tax=Siphonobacter sp. BAB-5385 TaxID=1864822 RepID=UPI000B9E8551|nr:hypothetical protein [Siphonobacter sp. BAB-5385]OZI05521.1 hypothetical protein BWI93_24975 [Siphonobacter sp. BAB-5385]
MKKILFTLVAVCSLFLIMSSCKPTADPVATEVINDPNAEDYNEESLSDEKAERIDELDSPVLDFDNIILPNGMTLKEFKEKYPNLINGRIKGDETLNGPQLRKNSIISNMLIEAQRLMNRGAFIKQEKEGGASDCKYCPAQPNGLAYAYGNKDYSVRKNPKGYAFEEVFGLDCSGFVYNAVKKGIKNFTAENTTEQKLTSKWNEALKVEKENKKLFVKDLGPLTELNLKAGDIVYWNGHIALVGVGGTNAILFQSNGTSAGSCGDPNKSKESLKCVKNAQEKNRGPKRGPRALSFKEAITPDYFGPQYRVIRILTDISGEWQLLGRCTQQSSDAIDMRITIHPEKDDEVLQTKRKVSAQGKATDYNGTTLIILTLEGEYNKETNILKANITLTADGEPDETRIDGFERPLNVDDTGYFPATSILSNGACGISWRLINKSSDNNTGGRKPHNKVLNRSLFKLSI